ncbi:hypothetical protein M430DRAFT_37475 [Amorphotheca resinae ATCC 22711]|uniref:Uncharacterized protein n=1 Tax=Amorphotheca resinae ATCC 22711 TaxID=857342 RepID=A0A2T3AR47_AMORE|nr:hypothetical protein M430DRAFT_37475 [Amorphotheca resinae ATCC 22711]PSS08702.1 hypothetical protein M430DRAFT_37475 [Amorphotheca resinae ATCC 22711]
MRNSWGRVGHAEEQLFMEDTINSFEKGFIDEWSRVARYLRSVEANEGDLEQGDPDQGDLDEDWVGIIKALRELGWGDYGGGCAEGESLEHLIRQEFETLGT